MRFLNLLGVRLTRDLARRHREHAWFRNPVFSSRGAGCRHLTATRQALGNSRSARQLSFVRLSAARCAGQAMRALVECLGSLGFNRAYYFVPGRILLRRRIFVKV